MKVNGAISSLVILLAVSIGLAISSSEREHDPRDLSYWSQVGATQGWSSAAGQGDARAQFFHGIAFIETNLVTNIDRIPWLSSIPIVGKRLFEEKSYGIDNRVSQEQLAEAYQWIKKSADQGFAPAQEAEKLFRGRIETPNQGGPPNGSQPIRSETHSTSSSAGSRR
jgi:TPR repeat protein